MKRFEERDVREAMAYASAGGQALHVWDPGPDAAKAWPRAPAIFKRNRPWAHLIDHDIDRLMATAKALGVRVVRVGRRGARGQHVDLCAGPLTKAIAMCEQEDPAP